MVTFPTRPPIPPRHPPFGARCHAHTPHPRTPAFCLPAHTHPTHPHTVPHHPLRPRTHARAYPTAQPRYAPACPHPHPRLPHRKPPLTLPFARAHTPHMYPTHTFYIPSLHTARQRACATHHTLHTHYTALHTHYAHARADFTRTPRTFSRIYRPTLLLPPATPRHAAPCALMPANTTRLQRQLLPRCL